MSGPGGGQPAIRDGRVCSLRGAGMRWPEGGLRLGPGVFETVRVAGGRAAFLCRHAMRMAEGIERIGFGRPFDHRTLVMWGRKAVGIAAVREGVLRMVFARGAGEGGPAPEDAGPAGAAAAAPGFLAWAREETAWPADIHERGVRAVCGPRLTDPASPLAGAKSLERSGYHLARREARRRGFDEALLRGPGGGLTEGSSTNIFWIEGGRLLTPPLSEGILAGVTRGVVLDLARSLSLEPREEPLDRSRLEACDEAFLTSALLGVGGLVRLEEAEIGGGRVGPVTRRIRLAWLAMAG